jgi:Ca2+/Na+ antiporter
VQLDLIDLKGLCFCIEVFDLKSSDFSFSSSSSSSFFFFFFFFFFNILVGGVRKKDKLLVLYVMYSYVFLTFQISNWIPRCGIFHHALW